MIRNGLVFGFLALAGTSSAQFAPQPALPNPMWTTVAEGNDCRVARAGTLVLSDQASWERHFRLMCGIAPNVQAQVPVIANWMTEDVIVVHLGQVRTAGYRVYVETVVRDGFNPCVRWVTLTPPTGVQLAQVVSSPYCIIRVQRTGGYYGFMGRTMVNPYSAANNWGCTAPAWRFGPGGLAPIEGSGGHGRHPQAWRFGPGGLTPLETGDGGKKGYEAKGRDDDHGKGREGGG